MAGHDSSDEQSDRDFSGDDLVTAMNAAARALIQARGQEETAETIVAGAIATIPAVAQAGISIVERDRSVTSRAPSTTVIGELDRLQAEYGEGPCLEAIHEEAQIEVPDTSATGLRWPRWLSAARERGVGSMLCLQLFAQKDSAGALNLYADHARAFDLDAQHIAGLFAAHAAVTLYGAQQVDHLNRALASRDEIGQAKGILMERFTLTPEQAFALLTRSSQDTNVKLASVARFVVREVAARGG